MSLKYERRLVSHLKHERYTPASIATLATLGAVLLVPTLAVADDATATVASVARS